MVAKWHWEHNIFDLLFEKRTQKLHEIYGVAQSGRCVSCEEMRVNVLRCYTIDCTARSYSSLQTSHLFLISIECCIRSQESNTYAVISLEKYSLPTSPRNGGNRGASIFADSIRAKPGIHSSGVARSQPISVTTLMQSNTSLATRTLLQQRTTKISNLGKLRS